MAWFFSADVGDYLGAAGGYLRSRPAEHIILLSVAETIRAKGPSAFGGPCLFGWWQAPGGAVAGPAARAVRSSPARRALTLP